MKVSVFPPGATGLIKENDKRSTSQWRENVFVKDILLKIISPGITLYQCINNWDDVSNCLKEGHRKRQSSMNYLFSLS